MLADIGDEQSLQQNLSTFSGHVRRIARIMEALSSLGAAPVPALVLLDEVGLAPTPAKGLPWPQRCCAISPIRCS